MVWQVCKSVFQAKGGGRGRCVRVHQVRGAEAMFVVYPRVPFISCFKLEYFVTVEFTWSVVLYFFDKTHLCTHTHLHTHTQRKGHWKRAWYFVSVTYITILSYTIPTGEGTVHCSNYVITLLWMFNRETYSKWIGLHVALCSTSVCPSVKTTCQAEVVIIWK